MSITKKDLKPIYTTCNCPKEKNCEGHYALEDLAKLGTSAFSLRDQLADVIKVPAMQCPFCQEHKEVQVIRQDWHKFQWDKGGLVQTYFPYLDKTVREQFITGICPPCFLDTFGEEE